MKKIIAMILCIALVAALSVSAFADWSSGWTISSGGGAQYDDGSGIGVGSVTVSARKTMDDYHDIYYYFNKIKQDKINDKIFDLPEVGTAKAVRAEIEAELEASAAVLKLANKLLGAYKDGFGKVVSEMNAAMKADVQLMQNVVKAGYAEKLALEYQAAAIAYANEVNKAIAEFEFDVLDSLSNAGIGVSISGIGFGTP